MSGAFSADSANWLVHQPGDKLVQMWWSWISTGTVKNLFGIMGARKGTREEKQKTRRGSLPYLGKRHRNGINGILRETGDFGSSYGEVNRRGGLIIVWLSDV